MPATLTQIAEDYGITKVTAKSRLVNLGLFDGHATKQGRAFIIDDEAVEELAKHYAKRGPKRGHSAGSNADASAQVAQATAAQEELIAELRSTIDFLKQQLADKDSICARQLAEKDEQIARKDEQISQLIAK